MRGILIALGIIFFCLTVEVIYALDDAVCVEEYGRVCDVNTTGFLMFRTQAPPINRDTIPQISPDRSGLNGTVDEILQPMQQQTGVTDVMGFFGFMFGSIMFLLNVFFNSTVGFYWWAQANLYLPSYLALTFQALIILNYVFVILQWVASKDIRGGG
jgi:hypothetical protein